MAVLQRQQLVWLQPAAWPRLLQQALDEGVTTADGLACLGHWAKHQLPLVVTRQPPGWTRRAPSDPLLLGLAAPLCWGRQRLFVPAQVGDVRAVGAFPEARRAAPLLPPRARVLWRGLCDSLDALGCTATVYGSHGWQLLSGLACLHAGSDIDLLLAVGRAAQADDVAHHLTGWPPFAPRLDGELLFADGAAVAWREWQAWRAGATAQVLVKRLQGAGLAGTAAQVLAA